jgi:hypothetical protein
MTWVLRTPLPANATLATWTHAQHAHRAHRYWALWNRGAPLAKRIAIWDEAGALAMRFAVDVPPKLDPLERGAVVLHQAWKEMLDNRSRQLDPEHDTFHLSRGQRGGRRR